MTTRELLSDDGRRRIFRVLNGTLEVGTDIETILTPTEANRDAIRDRARSALATNATFLAITSPTNAQNATQIKALTRECSALIRLLLSLTDTTDGT
jgi:hypothetical protein